MILSGLLVARHYNPGQVCIVPLSPETCCDSKDQNGPTRSCDGMRFPNWWCHFRRWWMEPLEVEPTWRKWVPGVGVDLTSGPLCASCTTTHSYHHGTSCHGLVAFICDRLCPLRLWAKLIPSSPYTAFCQIVGLGEEKVNGSAFIWGEWLHPTWKLQERSSLAGGRTLCVQSPWLCSLCQTLLLTFCKEGFQSVVTMQEMLCLEESVLFHKRRGIFQHGLYQVFPLCHLSICWG